MSSYLALLSFAVLGFALEMHLVFVNVIIGATVLTVVTRYLATYAGTQVSSRWPRACSGSWW